MKKHTRKVKITECGNCGGSFKPRTRKGRPQRFCSRECYKQQMRQDETTPYPRIWHNGQRIYLHRLIYMQATGEELSPNDIIHHKDENPFNRHPDNLEKVPDRFEHLLRHNFHRGKRNGGGHFDPESGCPF